MINISVIILTTNNRNTLVKTLLSLSDQAELPKEVVIIENSSAKSLTDLVTYFRKYLKINYKCCNSKSLGVVRNFAISVSNGHILAMVDDDCVLSPQWTLTIADTFEKYNCSVVQGWSENLNQKNFWSKLEQRFYFRWLKSRYSFSGVDEVKSGYAINTRNIAFIKKEISKKRIIFSKNVPYKFEDVDFGFKLIKKKLPVCFNPGLVVFHHNSDNFWDFIKRRYYTAVGVRNINKKFGINHKNSYFFDMKSLFLAIENVGYLIIHKAINRLSKIFRFM